jgi:hypothetical protein
MHLNWSPLGRLVALHHLMGAAAAVAAALISMPAPADTSVTVTAGTAEAAIGVKSYEVSTETEPVTDDTYWFCQVVGRPSIAGSVTVTTASGSTAAVIRHAVTGSEVTVMLLEDRSFFVTKAGVQVAQLIPAPIGSGLPSTASGFAGLSTDPAWQMFITAINDSNLRSAIAAQAGPPTNACRSACATQYQFPSDCGPIYPAIACCQVMTDRAYCQALCDCNASIAPATCRTIAATKHLAEFVACSYQYVMPQ